MKNLLKKIKDLSNWLPIIFILLILSCIPPLLFEGTKGFIIILGEILALVIFLVGFWIYERFSYWYSLRISNKVGLCFLEYSKNGKTIIELQNELSIDDSYKLNSNDTKVIIDILQNYRNDLTYKYFSGYFKSNKRLFKMTYYEFFMYTLEKFMRKTPESMKFYENDLGTLKNKTERSYGRYETTYELTNYGISYYRMYYIALLFCETNKYLNEHHDYCSEGLKKVLDSNKMTLYRL